MPSAGQAASTSVPPFVIKLYDLVTQPETDGIVCWGSTGNSFLLLDTRLFSQLVLPMHFKHDNLRSFERQLNIYGFQRCIAQPTEHALEFFHAKFRRGQRDLLLEIKRSQPARKRQLSADAPSAPGSTLAMDEASALNALQETMTETAAGAEALGLHQATAATAPSAATRWLPSRARDAPARHDVPPQRQGGLPGPGGRAEHGGSCLGAALPFRHARPPAR